MFDKNYVTVAYLGFQVLTIAVLVILITAPIGSGAIALSGPRLLKKSPRTVAELEVSQEETNPPAAESDEEGNIELNEYQSEIEAL